MQATGEAGAVRALPRCLWGLWQRFHRTAGSKQLAGFTSILESCNAQHTLQAQGQEPLIVFLSGTIAGIKPPASSEPRSHYRHLRAQRKGVSV